MAMNEERRLLVEAIAELLSGRHNLGYESALADGEDIVGLVEDKGWISRKEAWERGNRIRDAFHFPKRE